MTQGQTAETLTGCGVQVYDAPAFAAALKPHGVEVLLQPAASPPGPPPPMQVDTASGNWLDIVRRWLWSMGGGGGGPWGWWIMAGVLRHAPT